MTFGAPLALLGLMAIPLLAGLHLRRQRGSARAQAAFVAAPLAASVVPNRPGARRHLALAAFLAALAAIVVALANPRTTQAQPTSSSAIMLVCDVSGSMGATDVAPTRLAAVERAVRRFLAAAPARVSVGVMVFDQTPQLLLAPSTDRAAALRALGGWRAHGGTAIGTALDAALATLGSWATRAGSAPAASIVLLSDGGSTSGTDPVAAARTAAARRVPVDTVALGTPGGKVAVTLAGGRRTLVPVPPQPALLAEIARIAHGESFRVQDAARLDAVYRMLGAKLVRRTVTRTLEAGFAGAALALLALGAALSLRWFGRLV
jgi:Ca-activated chloride channel family protein